MQEIQSIDQIKSWYSITSESLNQYKREILKSLGKQNIYIPIEFFGMTEKEIQLKFDNLLKELTYLTCFNLIASIEATLQYDFNLRVSKRKKDLVSREFRKMSKLNRLIR